MFKSRLQELCQSKKWKLPEYILTREGLDHCPQFQATVVVNGCTYSTPTSSKSSKDAHNLAAEIAFHHLNGIHSFFFLFFVSQFCCFEICSAFLAVCVDC